MSAISRVSIDDTLHLLQLVRETALARSRENPAGKTGQAGGEKTAQLAARLEPVVERMKELRSSGGSAAQSPAGILGQADFKRLLAVQGERETEKSSESIYSRTAEAFGARGVAGQPLISEQTLNSALPTKPSQAANPAGTLNSSQPAGPTAGGLNLANTLERNRMIAAMAAGKMEEVEIARQFGLSREEVRLVLSTQHVSRGGNEVIR